MAADEKGRDLAGAKVYVTGAVAYAPVDTENVIEKAQLGSASMTVPAAFTFLGLRTSDGGPEETREAGEAIEFLEQGFVLNTNGTLSVAMTLAQYDAITRKFVHGVAPDTNGVIEVDFSTPSDPFILLLEAVFKDGSMERQEGVARLTESSRLKDERGTVKGVSVTLTWTPSELFNNKAYWEAQVAGTEAPVIPEG